MEIIQQSRSIIPACDVSLAQFPWLIVNTRNLPGIGGYKIGPVLIGESTYNQVVREARNLTDKPLIFDGQKWGTDTPHTAEKILTPLKESGIDAVILLPLAGPASQYAWTKAAQNLELEVIIGGHMTHPQFLSTDHGGESEEGLFTGVPGYIREDAPKDIYTIAARMGVTNFVMPGTLPKISAHYKKLIKSSEITPTIFAPGFETQGGDIAKFVEAIGGGVHLIIGRAIYDAPNMREAAEKLTNVI